MAFNIREVMIVHYVKVLEFELTRAKVKINVVLGSQNIEWQSL